MTKEIQEIVGMQRMPRRADLENLRPIYSAERNVACRIIEAFNYGVIQGKRQERERRRNAARTY